MSEGLYVSEKHRTRKRKRIAGIAVGVAVALGAGSYAVTTQLAGHDAPTTDIGAIAPVVSAEPAEPAPTFPPTTPAAPPPDFSPGTMSAQRQSSTPSPMPSPSLLLRTDEDIANAQVGRLLEPRSTRSGGVGIAATSERVTVRNEVTPDGANVRVVSAHSDLTGQLKRLWAGDLGRPVDGARCTHNIRTDQQPIGRTRPGMLLCWRIAFGKSVVAVATGRPQETYTAAVVAREWAALD